MSNADLAQYYLRRDAASRIHGPLTLDQLRTLIQRGEVSRFHEVSADEGSSWQKAFAFDELWETTAISPIIQQPDFTHAHHYSPRSAPPANVETSQHPHHNYVSYATHNAVPDVAITQLSSSVASPPPTATPQAAKGPLGLALAGFITATAALTISLIPLLIWTFQYTRGYWLIPIVFPVFVASTTGLVLSTVAFSRKRGGFSTTGLVVGICASVISLTTVIGWLVTSDPTTRWIHTLTAQSEADVALARINFLNSLNRYREPQPADDPAQLLTSLSIDLMTLSKAHARLLGAASTTPRFRQHFTNLDDLRLHFEQYREAINARDGIAANEAIARIGQSPETLKLLLDLLNLYQTGQISIETAQAKFR